MSTNENPERATPTGLEGFGRVASIDRARRQAAKRVAGLTEVERRLLLEEIARISAELCDLQVRAAEVARRVTAVPSTRVERTA